MHDENEKLIIIVNNIKENQDRILEVVRYIEQNLDKNLTLEMLAEIACFSPFHFQRIFKSIVGESPKQLIKRLRLEAAAHIITLSPQKSIFEVALSVGFSSLEAFSRAFKDYYSMSPDTFKGVDEVEKLKITRMVNSQRITLDDPSVSCCNYASDGEIGEYDIRVVSRPGVKFYHFRTTIESPQQISNNFSKAKKWAASQYDIASEWQLFGVIKDYPFITSLDHCRYLACVALNEKTDITQSHKYNELPSGIYASFIMKGGMHELLKAISYMYCLWIPDSGYNISPEHIIQIPLQDPTSTPYDENEWQVFIKLLKI